MPVGETKGYMCVTHHCAWQEYQPASGACGQWTLPQWCQWTRWKLTSLQYPWGSHTDTKLYHAGVNVHSENWPVLSIRGTQVPVGNELNHTGVNVRSEKWPVLGMCGEATQIQDCTSGVNVHGENWPVLSICGEATQIQDCTTVVSMYMVNNLPVLGICVEAANKTQLYHSGVNVHGKKLTSVGRYPWWSHKQDMTVPPWCQCYNVHYEKKLTSVGARNKTQLYHTSINVQREKIDQCWVVFMGKP